MARSLIGLVLLVFLVGAAHADGYGDFNSGVAAANRDDHDQAITSLSAALSEACLPEMAELEFTPDRYGNVF